MLSPHSSKTSSEPRVDDIWPSTSVELLNQALTARLPIPGEDHFATAHLPVRGYLPRLPDDDTCATALVLDVHAIKGENMGLSSFKANRWFSKARQLANEYSNGPLNLLVVIHGYKGGTAWIKAVERHFSQDAQIYSTDNPGVSVIDFGISARITNGSI